MTAMHKRSRIYVAGHRGLVGSAIVRRLRAGEYSSIIVRSHDELDLRNRAAVDSFFAAERPEYVFLAAAKVGGIVANSMYPADFIYDNLAISLNVIDSGYRAGVRKLLNLGSSCIYPKLAPQPLKEEYLLSGALEPTNEAYAIAKITALKLCSMYNMQYGTDFLTALPTNLYGPEDNFDLQTSHVLPALIRKFHEAKMDKTDVVLLWGDGTPLREFLHSDDLADALVFLMERKSAHEIGGYINVGTGNELTIENLARVVERIVYADTPGRHCAIEWDRTKPNGTPRKLLDISRMDRAGWRPSRTLEEGVKQTYDGYVLSGSAR